MKELLPYFKLLKPVRLQFLSALFFAIVYGLSSGFGLPFMTNKVFPLLFDRKEPVLELFTITQDGSYIPVHVEPKGELRDNLFVKNQEGNFSPFSKSIQVTKDGWNAPKTTTPLKEIYIKKDKEHLLISGGLYLKKSTDEYVPLQQEFVPPSKWTLILAVLLLPFVFFVRGISSFLNVYLINYCGLHVLEAIRYKVFNKLQHLHIHFFNQHKSGDLLNRLLGDTAVLQGNITTVANDIIKQPITLVGGVSYLIYQSIEQKESSFILLCFLVIGLCIIPIRYIGRQVVKRVFSMQEQLGSVAAIASENLQAFREVRTFNLQEKELSKFENATRLFFKLQLKAVKYNNGLNPLIEIVTACGISMAIYLAAKKGISLSNIIPLLMALYMSYDPIKKIGSINNSAKSALAALKRLDYILQQKDTIPDPAIPKNFPQQINSIHFKEVKFAYDKIPVLMDINLEIKHREVIALVGPSGAGKSTFGSLLPRFYDPYHGDILIDDISIKEFSKFDLRNHISIVSQDTVLFNDTIANNILIGQPNASFEEIQNAAQQAQAHEFIETLPDKYNTLIGERGANLSGGQKQRLAIARSFLKNAPILILDEATSSLDAESESKIQIALEKLITGKTVFIIAHRFSTIKLANRILVFEKGRITGDGSHTELIESNPQYKELYQQQGFA